MEITIKFEKDGVLISTGCCGKLSLAAFHALGRTAAMLLAERYESVTAPIVDNHIQAFTLGMIDSIDQLFSTKGAKNVSH